MYAPQQGVDIFANSGAVPSPAGVGSLQPARPSPEGGFPVGDAFRYARGALNLGMKAFPETMSPISNLIPSWGEIGSAVGMDGAGLSSLGLEGLGGALGGAMAAFGPAAAFLAWAQLMKSIAPPDDTSVLLGHGLGDMRGFQNDFGVNQQGLYDQFMGDGEWSKGGDPNAVEPMDFSFGSMSMKKDMPYHAIGRVPYRTPELAVNSGRSIARGMMGMPVTQEAIPTDGAGLSAMLRGNSLPVWDAPRQLPQDWNQMLDISRSIGTGEGQSSNDPRLDAWRAGQDPRTLQFFDAGLKPDDMWAFTGPQMADDPIYDLSTAKDETFSRVSNAIGAQGAQPFNAEQYGFGPAQRFFPDNWGKGA